MKTGVTGLQNRRFQVRVLGAPLALRSGIPLLERFPSPPRVTLVVRSRPLKTA